MVTWVGDEPPTKLYNLSCPPLAKLLTSLERSRRHGSAFWRRALIVTLKRLGREHEGLARITSVEILRLVSMHAWSSTRPKSGQARAIVRRFREMERRRYSRGDLTAADSYHPDDLRHMLRFAQGVLADPIDRNAVVKFWKSLGGAAFPERLWAEFKNRRVPGRALALVAAIAGTGEEAVKKTLQRARRRRHQTA